MGSHISRLSPPRLVLDTNVLVSALVFGGHRWQGMRTAWQSGAVIPLVCRETADELIRVLCYPKFRLDDTERDCLLAEFLPYAEVVKLRAHVHALPEVRDPDDAKFLALAVAGRADALISGDDDLLTLRADWKRVAILAPAEWDDWMAERQR